MEHLTQEFIAWTAQFPAYVALAIFATAFLESLAFAGILVPGILLLFGLAGLAGGGAITLQTALLAAFLGAVSGDIVSFYLGRYFSDDLKTMWPLSKYPDLVKRSEAFFHLHGGKSVIIGRFVGPIRPVLPAMAGVLGMPARRFVLFNLASALLWAPWYIVPGYLVGATVTIEKNLPTNFYPTLLLVILSIIVLVGFFAQIHWQLRPKSKIYLYIESLLKGNSCRTHLVRNSYSSRDQNHEYPISSALLFLFTLSGLILVTLLATSSLLEPLDQWILLQFTALHYPIADVVFVSITLIGDPLFIYVAMAWFITLISAQRRIELAAIYITAGISTHLLTSWLKNVFEIARPENPFNPESFSYPSGHTSGATLAIGLISASIARERPPDQRWVIYFCAGVIFLMVASSRLYLGVHWLSDVLGGLLAGLMICGLTRWVQSAFDRQTLWDSKWMLLLTAGLMVIFLAYQAIFLESSLLRYGKNLIG